MTLDPGGSQRYECRAGYLPVSLPERSRRPQRRPSRLDDLRPERWLYILSPRSPWRPPGWARVVSIGRPPLALLIGLLGCGSPDQLEDRLVACEPVERGIRRLWKMDERAPCGEGWLLDHAPAIQAAFSPLGRARMALRDLTQGEPVDPAGSLELHGEGLPTGIAEVHLERLAELVLPPGFADPWLREWHAVQQDDQQAAARLVAWSAWDPDEDRVARLLEEVVVRFDLEAACDDPECLWDLADELSAEEGPVGRRDAVSDRLWLVETSPRLAGVAGDWVGEWVRWVDGDREKRVVRMGVGTEPASALWVGGSYRGRTLLDAELGYSSAESVAPLLPGEVESDTAGGRAAALIPW